MSEADANLPSPQLQTSSSRRGVRERHLRLPGFIRRGQAFWLLLLIFIVELVALSVLHFSTDSFDLVDGFAGFVMQILCSAPLAILGLAALSLPPRRSLGIAKPPATLLLVIAGFASCHILFAGSVSDWIGKHMFSPTSVFEQMQGMAALYSPDTPAETFWFFCAAVIGAPVAEELFYRGFIQNMLSRVWKPWLAVLVTTVVFTLTHFFPLRFLLVFEVGLLLGLLYHRTGSLWLVICFHSASNLTTILITDVEWIETYAAFLLSLAGTACFGFLLLRQLLKMPHPDRSLRPREMQWSYLLGRASPCWALAFALVFLSSFFASAGAKELKQESKLLASSVQDITTHLETTAALIEFHETISKLRNEIKQDRATVQSLTTYLADADLEITRVVAATKEVTPPDQADATPKPKSSEEKPLPWEQDYLAWLHEELIQRFGLESPTKDDSRGR